MNTRLSAFLVMLVSLFILTDCGVVVRKVNQGVSAVKNSSLFHQGRHGPLNDEERRWAQIAWQYFIKNRQATTGLVNSAEGFPSATMWDVGDTIAALVSAYDLELIDECDVDLWLSQIVHFLNTMPLFQGDLPNMAYHTQNGQMVDFGNEQKAVGWSALDLGRLLIWLQIARCRFPAVSEYIDKAVLRWDFCKLIDDCGTLFGGLVSDGRLQVFQQGRLGVEEYVAKGYQLWGFDTGRASSVEPFNKTKIGNQIILTDARDPRETGVQAPLISLGYLLDGIEFNWDLVGLDGKSDRVHVDWPAGVLAEGVYRAQENRYLNERILTARTSHLLSKKPFFVYDSIFASGYAWNTIDEAGRVHENKALVATKAVFGMWALWKTNYTDRLMEAVSCLHEPKNGWFEGRSERSGGWERVVSLSTNALVLEALSYKSNGKLSRCRSEPGYYQVQAVKPLKKKGNCLPWNRRGCS